MERGADKIRIFVAMMPRLLREIITGSVTGEDDMEVVGEAFERGELLELLGEQRPDVVVVGCRDPNLTDIWPELLFRHPRIKILAIEEVGRRACLYRLCPEQVSFGEVSPALLLNLIRDAAGEHLGSGESN